MSDKVTSHHDDVAARPKKRGCGAHCKKFWLAYLIVSIVIVVLVVVLV
jgi:t-SNARE complex subunit (syntaxin)